MGIIWTILIGFVVGLLAKMLTPGRDPAGFFLTGGLGLGITRLSDERGNGNTQAGAGFLAGLGADLWMTPHASLTPFADFSTTRAGQDDLRDDLWRMGLGVTFH